MFAEYIQLQPIFFYEKYIQDIFFSVKFSVDSDTIDKVGLNREKIQEKPVFFCFFEKFISQKIYSI